MTYSPAQLLYTALLSMWLGMAGTVTEAGTGMRLRQWLSTRVRYAASISS